MIKSCVFISVAALVIAACSPVVVPTERGVGFDDAANRALRDAQLSAPVGGIVPPAQVNTIPSQAPFVRTTQNPAIASADLAAAGIGQNAARPALPANLGADPLRTQGLDASPSNPAPQLANSSGLSDEQNFDAVAGRETIESDAERRAAQAAVRQQVAPTAVPQRPRDVGPDIVEYALNAPNILGQEWYSRSLLSGEGRFRRNCAGYATPDDAQRDFLARGGPDRDRRGIDPDGDGFACGWDPAPFKQAFRN
ncbi:hypothetical protein [Yoonia sp.]|uniref:hypothetical protein n=1 Tax=Yoonia sp. TaxID=2212373 RepID=UPI0025F3A34A|nr:hypothetical protein [Yoonia sp.]